jgi:type IV pilus assembly protein PilA
MKRTVQKNFSSLTSHFSSQKGFTLIELLVVIGILAVLLAITLIAINPAKQFSQANDTKRRSDVNAILNAVNQYAADNKGNITPLAIPVSPAAAGIISDTGVDICAVLVPEYLAALPVDPLTNNGDPVEPTECAAPYDTNYTIVQSSSDNRITVTAPATEIDPVDISVTR